MFVLSSSLLIFIPTFDGTNILTPGARLLRHEYGHNRQSQRNGWTYLPKYGIPSASGANWTEVDAEFRSDQYFSDEYNTTPIFFSYPADYSPVNAKWWEHALIFGGGYVVGGGIVGVLNINRAR